MTEPRFEPTGRIPDDTPLPQIAVDPARHATLSQVDDHERSTQRAARKILEPTGRGHLLLAEAWPNGTVDEQHAHIAPAAVAEKVRTVNATFVDTLAAVLLLVPSCREREIAIQHLEDAHQRSLIAINSRTRHDEQPIAAFVREQDQQERRRQHQLSREHRGEEGR